MTYEQIVRAAKSPAEALVALARALDAAAEDRDDGWGAWPTSPVADAIVAPPPRKWPPAEPAPPAEAYAKVEVPRDEREIQRLREAVHAAEVRFEAARAAGEVDESTLLALQRAQGELRVAEDPGAILQNSGEVVGERALQTETAADGQSHVIELPVADDARKAARREFAEAIDLPGFFEPIMRGTAEQREAIIDTYVKGGPLWLWPQRRDIIAAMPAGARRVLVADVAQDSTRIAWDLGRDIFNEAQDEGGGLAVAQDNIQGIVETGGAVYRGKGD